MRKLRTVFGRREEPSAPCVRYLVKKVKETGILIDKIKREMPKSVRTSENIVAVAESAHKAPSTSVHSCSQLLNILETSLRRILHKEFVQLTHELKPIDHPMRFHFATWTCDRLTEHADLSKKKKKITISDEAFFFELGGYVNKLN